jgi:hypothetical protein
MTRPAREIPTDPTHPIYKKTDPIPLTEDQIKQRKNQKFFAAQNTVFTIVTK